ncbi:hypothetical protein [Streptomyces sp. NPDC050804]|uniref:hypothetical protein n=1 Tax=unclassified Streptomyces TaxID=2593676 RepID=UPI00341DAD72|nr:hypothetical protein OG214_33530 [Streptomyces sp. NBC_00872]
MPVRYVIASSTKRIIDECREKLTGVPGLEFRVGSVSETWIGCDAAVVWWPLAHEWYGGMPEPGVAQVLFNTVGDDAPAVILATPAGPGRTSGVGPTDLEIEDYTFNSLDACAREYMRLFPDRRESADILVHLEASGLDRRDMGAPIRGMARFLHAK